MQPALSHLHVHQAEEIEAIIHDPQAGRGVQESCLHGQCEGKYPGNHQWHTLPRNEERTVWQDGAPGKKEKIRK